MYELGGGGGGGREGCNHELGCRDLERETLLMLFLSNFGTVKNRCILMFFITPSRGISSVPLIINTYYCVGISWQSSSA